MHHLAGGVLGEVKRVTVRGGQDSLPAVTVGKVSVHMIIKLSLEGCKEGRKAFH